MAADHPVTPAGLAELAGLADERVDHRFKALPPDAEGLTVGALAAERRNLFTGGFTTPVLALSAESVEHNLALLETYAERHGLAFAPHGKTSMSPQLFADQLEHGAWGITAAVPHQARVYRAYGIQRIFLANELVDPVALRWLAGELDGRPGVPLRLLRRLGARCRADGRGPARRGRLPPGGCRGRAGRRRGRPHRCAYRGRLRGGRRRGGRRRPPCGWWASPATRARCRTRRPERVRAWLRRLVALAADFDKAGRFAGADEIVVSAGGSAWFDAVAEVFAEIPELSRPVLKLLRSGAYVSHDDGHYRRLTPFNRVPEEGTLQPAFRLWAQVVSRPSAEQAFVNAGKRDAAYDLDLPEAQVVRDARDRRDAAGDRGHGHGAVGPARAGCGPTAEAELEVGDWVGMGLSHPCTIFDKWQLIPLVEADGTVTDYIRTFF